MNLSPQLVHDRFDSATPPVLDVRTQFIQFVRCGGRKALALQILFQQGDVSLEMMHAAVLGRYQVFADVFLVNLWFLWLFGLTRSLACNGEVAHRHPETLKVGAGNMQVDLSSVLADGENCIDTRAAANGDHVADDGSIVMLTALWLRFLGERIEQALADVYRLGFLRGFSFGGHLGNRTATRS